MLPFTVVVKLWFELTNASTATYGNTYVLASIGIRVQSSVALSSLNWKIIGPTIGVQAMSHRLEPPLTLGDPLGSCSVQ
jgi:hypothetical protein